MEWHRYSQTEAQRGAIAAHDAEEAARQAVSTGTRNRCMEIENYWSFASKMQMQRFLQHNFLELLCELKVFRKMLHNGCTPTSTAMLGLDVAEMVRGPDPNVFYHKPS